MDMRRLILEASEKEIAKIGIELSTVQHIKFLELQHVLRLDSTEFAAIGKIEFKDPAAKVDLMANGFLMEAQVLEQEKNGVYTVFMRGGPILSNVLNSVGIVEGYLFPPLNIQDGKIRISFVGNERQVGQFLEKLNQKGIRYKVVLLAEADFSLNSPLNQLTEKQRKILIAAYKHGYYDVPRKINSQQLAQKLGVVDSTLVEHLRKAEHRLLTHVLNGI
ncbi:MAG: helix-turn-helix domain-containing protein [Candidatus Bathyarchaeota archaeon]|nr:helix-turn-helix domain-containing protein [Candidatus Bathyarchaeota archaeon]